MTMRTQKGRMLLISGPSGSGKSSICRELQRDPAVVFSVSATTRAPRAGEIDGVHYHFITPERFRELQRQGAFIESAEVHGNLYGTLREPMEKALEDGQVYLVEIDVQGALQLKGLDVPGLYVFVDVPDLDELRRRLEVRGTDSHDVVDRRLQKAQVERAERDKYDHVVINRDFAAALREVCRIAGLSEQETSEPKTSEQGIH